MSKIINGSSGTFSSSVAGLLVYLELEGALETPVICRHGKESACRIANSTVTKEVDTFLR